MMTKVWTLNKNEEIQFFCETQIYNPSWVGDQKEVGTKARLGIRMIKTSETKVCRGFIFKKPITNIRREQQWQITTRWVRLNNDDSLGELSEKIRAIILNNNKILIPGILTFFEKNLEYQLEQWLGNSIGSYFVKDNGAWYCSFLGE